MSPCTTDDTWSVEFAETGAMPEIHMQFKIVGIEILTSCGTVLLSSI